MQTQEIGPNNARNRANREAKKARRNEKHGQDEILFRGPIILTEEVVGIITSKGRDVRSGEHSSHPLLVNRLTQPLWLKGILLPTGSRILIDTRRPSGEVPCIEIVRNYEGWIRIHLWMQKRPWDLNKYIQVLHTTEKDVDESGFGGYSIEELEAMVE